ncbi:MAG: ribosomal protein S18-alanine N-acetyltransferase [Candidatus Korobacteraceae bacterium]
MFIRKATPEYLALIRKLEQATETAAHWAEREYDALFAADAPRRIALVAAEDVGAQILGFVIARCAAEEWEIENLVVAREQQRRGLGSALVRELVQEARQFGATSVLLEVRQSNRAARKLYEKLGFSESGRRKSYYRDPPEDALLLRISISIP